MEFQLSDATRERLMGLLAAKQKAMTDYDAQIRLVVKIVMEANGVPEGVNLNLNLDTGIVTYETGPTPLPNRAARRRAKKEAAG